MNRYEPIIKDVDISKRDSKICDSIKDAIKKGVREFIIGIGGSATNDGGIGMLRSLGFKFLDKTNSEICYAKDMQKIVKIDKSNILEELKDCYFKVACDVNNPLYGKNGASYVYAKQKGASDDLIEELDKGLKNFAKVALKNSSEEFDKYAGSGAAGGLGFAFLAFLNSKLQSGIEIILEELEFEKKIKNDKT